MILRPGDLISGEGWVDNNGSPLWDYSKMEIILPVLVFGDRVTWWHERSGSHIGTVLALDEENNAWIKEDGKGPRLTIHRKELKRSNEEDLK